MQDIIGAQDIIGYGQPTLAFGRQNALDALFSGRGPMVLSGADDPVSNAQLQLQRSLASHNAKMLVEREPTKAREYPLGFPTTAIPAGTTAIITSQPQVPFRARRLVIPSDIAGSILVNDLKIGKNSCFPSQNPVPGRMFAENAFGMDLNLDTAQISQVVVLNVTNTGKADLTFNAGIVGSAVE